MYITLYALLHQPISSNIILLIVHNPTQGAANVTFSLITPDNLRYNPMVKELADYHALSYGLTILCQSWGCILTLPHASHIPYHPSIILRARLLHMPSPQNRHEVIVSLPYMDSTAIFEGYTFIHLTVDGHASPITSIARKYVIKS